MFFLNAYHFILNKKNSFDIDNFIIINAYSEKIFYKNSMYFLKSQF